MTPPAAVLDDQSPNRLNLKDFGPSPMVSWTDLVAADAPTEVPTRHRLKALHKRNEVTDGVRVTLRDGQRAQGKASYHSVLSVWATRLRRLGHVSEADRLRDAGSKIEKTYDHYLRAYLSQHGLDDLPRADFFARLVGDTAAALASIRFVSDEGVLFVGEVKARRGRTWPIEGHDADGVPQYVNVLDRVLSQRNLGQGALVLVIERMVGNAAVTEVEPAVRLPSNAELLEGPPFGDDEYKELAKRYRKTGARVPSADERAADHAALADSAQPRRRITVKG
jgi:hypothetical protein